MAPGACGPQSDRKITNPGGARLSAGGGLQGLADRVAVLGVTSSWTARPRRAPESARLSRAVMIADDSVLFREGMASVLSQAGFEVAAQVCDLLARRRQPDPLARLTDREREVLALMAEGRSNRAIGNRLQLNVRTIESRISSILTKLELSATNDHHRRVLAVLTYLRL
jgi:DNA-binding NarL/FixJ family response regulator